MFSVLSDYKILFDLIIAAAAVIAIIVSVVRFFNRSLEKKIIKEIREATTQIQPNANGGKSLADLHAKIDALTRDVCDLKVQYERLDEDVHRLENNK